MSTIILLPELSSSVDVQQHITYILKQYRPFIWTSEINQIPNKVLLSSSALLLQSWLYSTTRLSRLCPIRCPAEWADSLCLMHTGDGGWVILPLSHFTLIHEDSKGTRDPTGASSDILHLLLVRLPVWHTDALVTCFYGPPMTTAVLDYCGI